MNHEQGPLLAHALAQGCTQAEAGQRAGVSERTLRRRLEDPGFKAMVTQARDQLIKETADRFTSLQAAAIDTIESALTDPRTDTRLRTAKMILDIGSQFRDRVEPEARLQAVEADTIGPASATRSVAAVGAHRSEAATGDQFGGGGVRGTDS